MVVVLQVAGAMVVLVHVAAAVLVVVVLQATAVGARASGQWGPWRPAAWDFFCLFYEIVFAES
jgi:hypothetical protein